MKQIRLGCKCYNLFISRLDRGPGHADVCVCGAFGASVTCAIVCVCLWSVHRHEELKDQTVCISQRAKIYLIVSPTSQEDT